MEAMESYGVLLQLEDAGSTMKWEQDLLAFWSMKSCSTTFYSARQPDVKSRRGFLRVRIPFSLAFHAWPLFCSKLYSYNVNFEFYVIFSLTFQPNFSWRAVRTWSLKISNELCVDKKKTGYGHYLKNFVKLFELSLRLSPVRIQFRFRWVKTVLHAHSIAHFCRVLVTHARLNKFFVRLRRSLMLDVHSLSLDIGSEVQ